MAAVNSMAERLRIAAEQMRDCDTAFLRAVADLLDQEREELEHGDPYYVHKAALRAADAFAVAERLPEDPSMIRRPPVGPGCGAPVGVATPTGAAESPSWGTA